MSVVSNNIQYNQSLLIKVVTLIKEKIILSGILITCPTPDHGLCNSPKYRSLNSSPCISLMSKSKT